MARNKKLTGKKLKDSDPGRTHASIETRGFNPLLALC